MRQNIQHERAAANPFQPDYRAEDFAGNGFPAGPGELGCTYDPAANTITYPRAVEMNRNTCDLFRGGNFLALLQMVADRAFCACWDGLNAYPIIHDTGDGARDLYLVRWLLDGGVVRFTFEYLDTVKTAECLPLQRTG